MVDRLVDSLVDTLKAGNRVRLNAEGRSSFPRHHKRLGRVIRWSRARECVVVLWDGRKTSESIHHEFIELAETADATQG
jgi:hypothetical protein